MQKTSRQNSAESAPQAIKVSNVKLLKYSLFSVVFAAITLITIILPAEYNIDPTGLGHKLGLTVFNKVGSGVGMSNAASVTPATIETIEVIVPARKGVEYKFTCLCTILRLI